MIYRIIGYSMLFCLFLAIGLSAFGYDHVDIGTAFLAFMRQVNADSLLFKIEIPDIPLIPRYERQSTGGDDIFTVLISLLNGMIFFVNMIIQTINLIADIINLVIQLLQTIFIIIRNLIYFKNIIPPTPSPSIPVV